MASGVLDEGAVTHARIIELYLKPVHGRFDCPHLKEVHRRIFQDLPHHGPGEFRPEARVHKKLREFEGPSVTYPVIYANRSIVDETLDRVLGARCGVDVLRALATDALARWLAGLYGDLDYLHPFREGNSRTLRVFTHQLMREIGYELDWGTTNVTPASRDRLYHARDREVLERRIGHMTEGLALLAREEGERDMPRAYAALMYMRKFDQPEDRLACVIKECLKPV